MRFPFLRRVFGGDVSGEIEDLRKEMTSLRVRRSAEAGYEPLLAIARALRDAQDLGAFADAAVEAAMVAIAAFRGALVVDRKGELVVLAAREGHRPVDPKTFPLSRTIASVAARNGEVVATGRAAEDARFRSQASVARFGTESVLALPLRRGEKPVGCLYLEAPPDGFSALSPEMLLALVDLIAVALARLESEGEREQRAKLQAIGLVAAAIAHDLNSPLTSTAFALSMVKPQDEGDERALARARTSCMRARELAKGLVGLATGRLMKLAPKTERVAQLLEEHLATLSDELADAKIELVRELDAAARANVDRTALLRVVDNLIRNAEKAMASGGKLTVGCAPRDGKVALWVADSGPGMTREQIDRLFQVSEETLAGGLGLTVVRTLVTALEGTIETESAPGRGTRFTLLLPPAIPGSASGVREAPI